MLSSVLLEFETLLVNWYSIPSNENLMIFRQYISSKLVISSEFLLQEALTTEVMMFRNNDVEK